MSSFAQAACYAAANYIEKYGWWDGKREHKTNKNACLVIALDLVCGKNGWQIGPSITLIQSRIGDTNFPTWNDSHTKQEVIDLLRSV